MRKKLCAAAILLLCFLFFGLCLAEEKTSSAQTDSSVLSITGLAQLSGKKIAVPEGTLADSLVLGRIPDAQIAYYPNVADCIQALIDEKVDAVAYDEPILRNFLRYHKELSMLSDLITKDTYAIAIHPSRSELQDTVNKTLKELDQTGALQKMENFWFDDQNNKSLPLQKNAIEDKENILTLATFAGVEPFSFKNENGDIIGYDIELGYAIAAALEARLVVITMPFDELIPAVTEGRVDISAACLTVTPERAGKVFFSTPYYKGGIAVLVKNPAK